MINVEGEQIEVVDAHSHMGAEKTRHPSDPANYEVYG